VEVQYQEDDTGNQLASAEIGLFGPSRQAIRECHTFEDGPLTFGVDALRSESLAVIRHSMHSKVPFTANSECDAPILSFCLCLKGDIGYRYETMSAESAWEEGAANLWVAGNTRGYTRQPADRETVLMDVVISQDGFATLAALDPELLGPIERALRAGDTRSILPRDIPIDPHIHRVAHELLESESMGSAAHIYRQAKVLELFSLFLRWDRPLPASRERPFLRADDLERLHHARSILLKRMLDPPSISELARLAGINEFKLKKGFRELFGDTVFGVLGQHRMALARRLLLDTEQSVQQIAAQCGYEHQSHFSTAFRRHAGCAPLEFRKGNFSSIYERKS
jgi:AraC-like DNA-binding protein